LRQAGKTAAGLLLVVGLGQDVDIDAVRMTWLMTEPCTSSVKRDRWVAPRSSWVAFSALAKLTRAAAVSLPETSA
jgi:hypothetical protein